jgi:hypothetical protein
VLIATLRTEDGPRREHAAIGGLMSNSSGGVMGKMIDAQSIVVAATATNLGNLLGRGAGSLGRLTKFDQQHRHCAPAFRRQRHPADIFRQACGSQLAFDSDQCAAARGRQCSIPNTKGGLPCRYPLKAEIAYHGSRVFWRDIISLESSFDGARPKAAGMSYALSKPKSWPCHAIITTPACCFAA